MSLRGHDVILGFNYEFNALNPEGTPNELDEAFSTLFREPGNPRPIEFLRAFVPIFRLIVRALVFLSAPHLIIDRFTAIAKQTRT